MANERYLDLDAFATEPGKIRYKGETYEIQDISVELYAKAIKLQDKIDNATDDEDVLNGVMELLGAMIPDMPFETIKTMNIKQLSALLGFVVQDLQSELEKNGIAPSPAPHKTKTTKKNR